jgi:hypothetical protein
MDRTLLILGVELRQAFRAGSSADGKSSRAKRIARNIMGYAVLLTIAVFMGRGAYNIAANLSEELAACPNVVRTVWVNLMSGLSLGIFIMFFMTGVSVVYQTLYESGDLKFLLSTPTPAGSVVAAKLIVALVRNLMAIVPFMYPVWVGYGAGSGAPVSFYIMSLLAIVFAALLFTAVVAIFVMLVMRIIPTQKMRQIIMIGSLAVGFAFVVVFQVFNAKMARSNGLDTAQLAQAAQGWGLGNTWYLPHVWVVKTALLTTSEFGFSFAESLLPLAVTAVGAFASVIGLSTKAFLAGWSAAREVEKGRKKPNGRRRRRALLRIGRKVAGDDLAEGVSPALSDTMIRRHVSQGWGIFAKDLTILMRQPVIWYSVLVALVASGFYIYNMSYGMRSGDVGSMVGLMKDIVLFVLVMMSTISSSQMAGMCISMDGESLWAIRSMPIEPGTYYNSKMALAMLPGSAVFTVLALAMTFVSDLPQYPLYVSLPVGYAAISMLGSIGLMFDAIKPNFTIRMSGAGGPKRDASKALISMGVSLVGTFLLGVAFAFKGYYSSFSILAGIDRQVATCISVIAFAAIVVAGHVVARSIAIGNIKRMLRGESN